MQKKILIGLVLIVIFAVLIFSIPQLIGKKNVAPVLSISALVLVSIYIILSLEIIHRGSLALLGATIIVSAAIGFGALQPEESLDFIIEEAIDFNTIGLLLGMMVIVAILGETGVFYWVGIKATNLSQGNLWKLMLLLSTFTAIASMFIDNVTTILLMVPVTLSIVRILKVPPIPFILSQALVSNIGGAATLIGDPPNILIGSAANIDFNSFLINMGPTVAIVLVASLLLLKFFFRKDLQIKERQYEHQRPVETDNNDKSYLTNELMRPKEGSFIKDKNLLMKCMIVLVGVIALFSLQNLHHLEVSVIALGGAAILLVISRAHFEKILHEVDWSTLIFFTGLFIIVGIAQHVGLIGILSSVVINLTGGNFWNTYIMIIWLSGIASAFVDNIPFTATMIPLIEALNADPNIALIVNEFEISPLWWALAIGADFGGNGTLIGSSAGVVAAGLSERFGYRITFIRWLKIGFPFMLITLTIASVILPILTIIIMPH
ncbi:MAG TPA: ArsB/NhaD family transporter [Nitrososphaeraceae archaeon]|nr:ArsB/NhaD family transporter [Nitrososphaeraceae archaeon]